MIYIKPEMATMGRNNDLIRGASKWIGFPFDAMRIPNIFAQIPAYEADE